MLPTHVVVLGLELWPLDDPSLGWKRNWRFYVRDTVRVWIVCMANYVQLHEFIPELRQPWHLTMINAFIFITPYIGSLMIAAAVTGVFPVPFSTIVAMLPSMPGIFLRAVCVRRTLEQHPELKHQNLRFQHLTGFSFATVLIYSGYGFAFTSVGTELQLVLSFGLYAIKYAIKYITWKLSHVQAHHDFSAECDSCGAHLFHTLFMTACFQNARSSVTFAIGLGLSFSQDLITLHSIHKLSVQTNHTAQVCLQGAQSTQQHNAFDPRWTAGILHTAQLAKEVDGVNKIRYCGASFRQQILVGKATQIVPSACQYDPSAKDTTHQQLVTMVHSVAHLMHCREAMLLRMFVDVFVPIVYLSYVGFLLHGPTGNLQFFPSLADMDERNYVALSIKVSILVSMKLVAFALVCGTLRWHRQPSGVSQLVFVLVTQRWTMQSWFVISFLQLTNFQLAHMGNDLSFRFQWLRKAN